MPGQADLKTRAVDALDTAIEAHIAARDKVEDVIALKDLNGTDTSAERAQRAALDVTIGNLQNERAEYNAAATVVAAPDPTQIAKVRGSIQEIRDLAVADATRQAGQDVIRGVLEASLNLKNKNAKA